MKILGFISFVILLSGCTAEGFKAVESAGVQTRGTVVQSKSAIAKVLIKDQDGNPTAGVTVTGTWSGVVSGRATSVSEANGYATFVSSPSAQNGAYNFQVTGASKAGTTYDSGKNKVSSAELTR